MTLSSLLKLFKKIIIGGILLGSVLLYGAWQWEESTARSLLDKSIQALQQGNAPLDYRLTYEQSLPDNIANTRYRIVHQDQHLFWGRWYCVSFTDGAALMIDIFPHVLQAHEVNIKRVPGCSSNS